MRLAAENAGYLRDTLSGDAVNEPLPRCGRLDVEVLRDPGYPVSAQPGGGGMECVDAHATEGYPECRRRASDFGTGGAPLELAACNDDDMAKTLRYRIATLRIEAGEQQADLAAAVGCARSMISAIETGRKEPGRDLLFAIAAHYGVSADWLQTGAEAKPDDLAELIKALRDAPVEVVEAVRLMLKATRTDRR